ncbi:MAG: helix-turn-helix transcriptional regulator [Myxococcales bacterium]|nr:helix-turn-helix transcriptional regulator [Myxococcales bacterium]
MRDGEPASFEFLRLRPRGPLARFVSSLWFARGRIHYQRDAILPGGHLTLILNLGAPHRTFDPRAPQELARSRLRTDAWLCGQQRGPILSEPTAETHMVGAFFHPARAAPFLGGSAGGAWRPAAELTDQLVSLESLWGATSVARARDEIASAGAPAAKLAALGRVLEARLNRAMGVGRPPLGGVARLERALALLEGPRGHSVAAVCEQLGVSARHLGGECRRLLGVSPKTYARIVRFNRALRGAARGAPRWSELARACEYYDQAHFIRDFRRFSGLTPGEYVARRRAVYGEGEEAAEFVPMA